ncbi:MAG: response regulator transcription factor [Lentimicrobium sp.]|jgi:DNA-binding NarL/FixJ family response regulator|nr:response regulator transcription factor [Lentimicrobium sp.]MDD2528338.1 response regulator transcription factor [Lentimicrobiaceae bacterium]MDY0025670.1 response regulator transcription factor [Lentimicrobium sp.]
MEQHGIFIADPHALFREGLKKVIQTIPFLTVAGECSHFDQLLPALIQHSPPELLLIHLIPFKPWVEVTEHIIKEYPETKTITILNDLEHHHAQHLIDLNVNGVLHTSIAESELKHAFHIMAQGKKYFSSSIIPLVTFRKYSQEDDLFNPSQIKWKPRDLELIRYLCKGYDNHQICEELCLQCRTVEGLKTKLMIKANVPNTVNLILFALKNKLVDINEL